MSAATAQSDSNRSAWTVILAGAALIATLAMGTWGWQKYAHPPEELVAVLAHEIGHYKKKHLN